MEDRFEIVMLGVLTLLDIVLLINLRSKIKAERKYTSSCEKMSAVVEDISKKKLANSMLYSFIVKAENGCTYNVSSSSFSSALIMKGSTVKILVPQGAPARTDEDKYMESVVMGGREALNSLSHEEKLRLNDYLSRKSDDSITAARMMMENNVATLASDGRELKNEIIPLGVLAGVVSLIILVFCFTVLFGR
ncbi:hypothetical protein [Ruminococcus albus]|uniref:Uncharacterized protein n=1 Tax=Ruminococcus albus TaxID=1264 RepID=A0A1I1GW50_RUMAL|nr:hypothetical protein [Ruminococcus albus]SFC15696.1 hypothetical protein SAMN02910406_01241 [Ruminococcus albus]